MPKRNSRKFSRGGGVVRDAGGNVLENNPQVYIVGSDRTADTSKVYTIESINEDKSNYSHDDPYDEPHHTVTLAGKGDILARYVILATAAEDYNESMKKEKAKQEEDKKKRVEQEKEIREVMKNEVNDKLLESLTESFNSSATADKGDIVQGDLATILDKVIDAIDIKELFVYHTATKKEVKNIRFLIAERSSKVLDHVKLNNPKGSFLTLTTTNTTNWNVTDYYFYVFKQSNTVHVVLLQYSERSGYEYLPPKYEAIGTLEDEKKIELLLAYEQNHGLLNSAPHYKFDKLMYELLKPAEFKELMTKLMTTDEFKELMAELKKPTEDKGGKPKRSLRKRRKTKRRKSHRRRK